jgi:hypothetical protein
VKRRPGFIDGAMNTSGAGASRATSSSICESAIEYIRLTMSLVVTLRYFQDAFERVSR